MKLAVAIVVLVVTASCEAPSGDSRSAGDTKQKSRDTNSADDATDERDAEFDFASLFRDEMDFKIADFDVVTNCGVRYKTLTKSQILPWTSDQKKRLVAELKRFPEPAKIAASVYGYYVVDKDFENLKSGAAGQACRRSTDQKSVILLNSTFFGEDADTRNDGMSSDHTASFYKSDTNVLVMLHETFHALDGFYFVDDRGGFRGKRSDPYKMAWRAPDDSKYEDIGILTLTADKNSVPALMTCSYGQPLQNARFSLLSTADDDIEDLKYMSTKTNFIAPYAMSSAFEDFAETITIYYLGTKYDEWPVWKVVSNDLSEGYDPSKTVFEYDSKATIAKSKPHREKMCALAELVFEDEDCEAKLP